MVRFSLFLLGLCAVAAYGQAPFSGNCVLGSDFPSLRSEGLTESIGNITLNCSGASPNVTFTGTYTLTTPLPITNQIDANGFTSQAVLSVDYLGGGGFQPVAIPGLVSGQSISFSGVAITPTSGSYNIRISNVRVPAHQLGAGTHQIAVNVTAAPQRLGNSEIVAGTASPGLFVSMANNGIPCTGSPLPNNPSMTNLFAAGTSFSSTRVTEGFASAFTVKGTGETNGTRFVVTYSGFPSGTHVYLPNLVAGSDAATPSIAGDLGGTATVGQYLPGSGTLLLGLVTGADANGVGGTPLAAPTGGAPVTLDAVTEVSLTGGAGYAVYEVLDANPNVQENAQFPTFVGLANISQSAIATETITIGPISTVATPSSTDPNPRFALTTPTFDCSIVGDCYALYYPKLKVPVSGTIQLAANAGGAMTSAPGYIPVQNIGGGTMVWNVTVNYQNGSGWLVLQGPLSPVNNGSVRVVAQAQNLVAGTYQANIVIDAGLEAGSATVPVTLTVQPTPDHPAPTVVISKVVSTATLAAAPLVPGSVATLQGSGFRGQMVTVTVGGQPASVIYSDDSLLIFIVPAALGGTSADVVVSVDGVESFPMRAVVAPAYPVIFAHAIRNQDWTENTTSSPAPRGSVLQIFGTGIPAGATVVAQIGGAVNLVPVYAGPAPGIPGLQQVNLAVPSYVSPGATQLILCASVNSQPYCSDTYPLSVN